MMAVAGAAMVLSTLPELSRGLSLSLAAFDFTKTTRAGSELNAVGPIFMRSTSSTSRLSGTSLGCQSRLVRASRKSRLRAAWSSRMLVLPVPCARMRAISIPKTPPVAERGRKNSAAGRWASDGPHFLNVGAEVPQQVLDPVAQGGRRARAAGTGAAHVQEDHAVLEAAEHDVAAVVGDRRPHARVEQLLDGLDRVLVLRVVALERRLLGGVVLTVDDGSARQVVLHDGAEDGRLQMLPLVDLALGHGDEVGAEEHPGHVVDAEQTPLQRRGPRLLLVAEVHRPVAQHRLVRYELERGWVGSRLGLNEHRWPLALDRLTWNHSSRWGRAGQNARPRSRHTHAPRSGSEAHGLPLLAGRGRWLPRCGDLYRASEALGGRPNEEPPAGGRAHRPQASALMSSRASSPGTMVMGMGNLPALAPAASEETSGPGPAASLEAPSTSTAMSSSSSICLRISSTFLPSRITSSVGTAS